MGRDRFGLSPLAIQQRHDEAFNVEAVTRDFFRDYRRLFEHAEASINGLPGGESLRLFTQRLFNRLMFIVFLERKGWMRFNGRTDYLRALWQDHQRRPAEDADQTFYRDRLKHLFFAGLNNQHEVDIVGIKDGFLQTRIGHVPYLNGGLFEEDDLDRAPVDVPDAVFRRALDELFYHYNFTVTESTPLDVEVAVDPEMLGKVFEELVTGRHESGSYYTPKPIVSFMGREALKGYLESACTSEATEAVAAFVDRRDATRLRDPEGVLRALREVTICDPACGSGAYLVGMLHELLDLRQALFASRHVDALTVYERKLQIIQHNLYGVDVDLFAINIARLRLWLSLVVDYEGDHPEPLPNLDFKIEVGDSLTGPDPSGGLQPDLFRQQQIKDYFRLKSEYMESHGGDKRDLRQKIDELREAIRTWAHPTKQQLNPKSHGFDWLVEFAEVFERRENGNGGFDIVIANPPYVRADTQFHHLTDETERQAAIEQWQEFRRQLKKYGYYETLFEKWDLYIPFLERARQLLAWNGGMIVIVPDAYNTAKYANKSHEYFLENSTIARLDFCSDIPLFEAGVFNTIVHIRRQRASKQHQPTRVQRSGANHGDFELNKEELATATQSVAGRMLFRPEANFATVSKSLNTHPVEQICYVSYGMRPNADDRYWRGEFRTEDVISDTRDSEHPKPFLQGKNVEKWCIRQTQYLEWGTDRAPAKFARATFQELYEVPEKLIAAKVSIEPKVAYDDNQYYHSDGNISFVPWHHLVGVVNRSIDKTAKYRFQSPDGDRELRERESQRYNIKFVLAIMNSRFAADWISNRRRNRLQLYPDDWKQLPIIQIPFEEQQVFVDLVDQVLEQHRVFGCPTGAAAAERVKELESELDALVSKLYIQRKE
jgi:hypothetical protein